MNDQSETERGAAISHWFGLDQLRLSDGEHGIDVTVGPGSHWDRSHLRRLRQSGDLPGMVPIIDADFSADGKPFAVTPVVESPTLASMLESGDLSWTNGAGIAEASARAIHEAHLRGLFHGAISPSDVYVLGNDVAISGVGLGLGGRLPADRLAWAAPEVRDGADPTERSDVYSLGKLLEASLGPALDNAPRSIRRLIMWSSSDTPEARPPSAMEFASILAEGLGEERKTYGPAFISTSEMNELATRASSAVSSHTPSEAARSLGSAVPAAGVAGAAAAVAGVGALAGQEPEPEPETDADAGFQVADTDPGTTIDAEVTAPLPADIAAEPATPMVAASQAATVAAENTTTSEEADDAPVTAGRSQFVHEYAVPAAAQTVDLDETYLPRKQRRRAGLMFAGILVLGLAAIAWGIVASGNNDDSAFSDGSAAPVSEAVTTPSSEAPASSVTEAPASSVTEAPASSVTEAPKPPQSSQQTPPAPNTATTPGTQASTPPTTAAVTAPPPAPSTAGTQTTTPATQTTTTVAPATSAVSLVPEGGMKASQAAVQVLHGVPGAQVDVYVDGKALTTGFKTGEIAGPVKLTAGSYDVALFAADPKAPLASADRTDKPLLAQKVAVGAEPATLVAHLDDKGQPTLTPFKEDLSPVAPGQSRVVLRNLMADGPVDASVNGTIVGTIAAGEVASAVVPAGTAKVEFLGDDGKILTSANVTVGDGELASLSAIGAPASSTAQIVIERFTGLSTAPAGVPTGNSGLLGLDEDQTGLRLVFGLMVVLALSGGVVAFRRQRSWS